MRLSQKDIERYRKLYNKVSLPKLKDEVLASEDEIKRLAVVLAVLEFHATQGKQPTEDETEEKAIEIYIHLLFEKMKREGLVNVIYSKDKKRILKASLTEKGVKQALKIIKGDVKC